MSQLPPNCITGVSGKSKLCSQVLPKVRVALPGNLNWEQGQDSKVEIQLTKSLETLINLRMLKPYWLGAPNA